jgi:plastocyanin
MNKKIVITAAVVGVIVIAGLALAITRTLAGGGRISIPSLTTKASPATTTTNKAAPPTSTSTSATPTTAAPTSNQQLLQLSQQQQQNQQQQKQQQPANVVTVSIVKGASNMGNKAYSPNPIQIQRGTTVVWRNDDTTLHTAVSGKGMSDTSLGKMFESPPIAPGKTFSYKFDAVGTYDYFCTLHPAMVGTVVVK